MGEYLAGAIDFTEQRRRRLRGFLATFGGIGPSDDAAADAASRSSMWRRRACGRTDPLLHESHKLDVDHGRAPRTPSQVRAGPS
jgi:hypothetical protein